MNKTVELLDRIQELEREKTSRKYLVLGVVALRCMLYHWCPTLFFLSAD